MFGYCSHIQPVVTIHTELASVIPFLFVVKSFIEFITHFTIHPEFIMDKNIKFKERQFDNLNISLDSSDSSSIEFAGKNKLEVSKIGIEFGIIKELPISHATIVQSETCRRIYRSEKE